MKNYILVVFLFIGLITNAQKQEVQKSIELFYKSLMIDFYSDNKFLTSNGYGLGYKFQNHPILNVSKKQAID